MITASFLEEVRRYIQSCKTMFEALQILKELYDSHSELEIIQLLLKLFNLDMKENHMASEIKVIFHDIEATSVKLDLQLFAFVKALHHAYSHYLESLQASGKLKDIIFDKLVNKNVEREKAFGK